MSAVQRTGLTGGVILGCVLVFSCAIVSLESGTAASEPVPSGNGAASAPEFDAAKVKGAVSCQKCHKSEFAAWEQTKHFSNHERITSSAGKGYIEKLGGKSDACYSCHSTPHESGDFGGKSMVGVSCESCHTPAGGDAGWFNLHSNYGAKDLNREQESADHLKERLAACDAAGMIRAENAYALAKNCYSCHIVSNEEVLQAGHKGGHSDFDLIPWMQGEVRHNFQVDQTSNAESPSLLNARSGVEAAERKRVLLVVGKLVELETCLRNLAKISEENLGESYAGRRGWAGRAEDAFEYLEEEIAENTDNKFVKDAVEAVEDIDLGRKFEDQAAAQEAADKLSSIAKEFAAASHDDLEDLDELVEDLDKPKGTAYKP